MTAVRVDKSCSTTHTFNRTRRKTLNRKPSLIQLSLYQPEIPQNTGTMLRLAACWGVDVNIIGPCGFVWSERRLKRAGMDYIDHVNVQHFPSWTNFKERKRPGRLVLLTPHTEQSYLGFPFHKDDCLMVGQESSGVPQDVFDVRAPI